MVKKNLLLICSILLLISCNDYFTIEELRRIYRTYPNPAKVGDTLTVWFSDNVDSDYNNLSEVELILRKETGQIFNLEITAIKIGDRILGKFFKDQFIIDSLLAAANRSYIQGVIEEKHFPGGKIIIKAKDGFHIKDKDQISITK